MPEFRSKSDSSTLTVGVARQGGGDVQGQRGSADARLGRQERKDLGGGDVRRRFTRQQLGGVLQGFLQGMRIEGIGHEFAHAQTHHGAQDAGIEGAMDADDLSVLGFLLQEFDDRLGLVHGFEAEEDDIRGMSSQSPHQIRH